MLYDYKEVIAIYGNDYNLKKALLDKRIFKIEKGMYSDGEHNFTTVELVLKKYKNAFLVKESALHLIGFVKDEPDKIHIGTARNALRIRDSRIQQHFYSSVNISEFYDGEWDSYENFLSYENIKKYTTENNNEIRFPNDFRILLRYMTSLVHFKENTPENVAKIIAIYENIKQNCNNDKIRISAKRHIAELYKGLSEKEGSGITFDDCEKIIKEMPKMRDGQEMFCFYYPENYPNGDEIIMNTLEEQFLLLDTVYSHYFHYNGFFYDRNFSDEWVLSAFKTELDFLNFVYDDGHYGKMWRTVMYNYGHLGVRYFKMGDNANALENFRKMCELAIKFDNMDRITTMHSVMFKGKEFDKHTLGTTYVAKTQIKELLTEKYPLSEDFKESDEFKEMLSNL